MNVEKIQGRWEQIRGQVREHWGQLTDDDLQMVQGNVEQVIGRIREKTGETRHNVEHFLDDLVDRGGSVLNRAMDKAASFAGSARSGARDGMHSVQQQARQGYRQAEQMVRRHPTESLATMFGLGCLTGLLVAWLCRSDD